MRNFETEAAVFMAAIKALSENPCAFENLENYLSIHFDTWLTKFASTPNGIASELKSFSEIGEN